MCSPQILQPALTAALANFSVGDPARPDAGEGAAAAAACKEMSAAAAAVRETEGYRGALAARGGGAVAQQQ